MKILATSGGLVLGSRTFFEPGPIIYHALEMAGSPERPRLCFVGTAEGDDSRRAFAIHEAFYGTSVEVTCLNLFPMPNFPDVRGHLLLQDVIWVGGGSVANLLAVWRVHGLDEIMRECWEAGVVLGGVSAGSICWHVGGTTDSFGPNLRPVSNGIGLLPYGNGVHYDAEPQRRPLLQRLVGDGILPTSFATDNGVGLVYEGTEMIEAVSDRSGAAAYKVCREDDGSVAETRIEPRLLT